MGLKFDFPNIEIQWEEFSSKSFPEGAESLSLSTLSERERERDLYGGVCVAGAGAVAPS